jgi:hypothetical protein
MDEGGARHGIIELGQKDGLQDAKPQVEKVKPKA